jgi:ABC-2 type transport system ATP-binding protein
VAVELADGRGAEAAAAVAGLGLVLEVQADGSVLRARVASGGAAVPAILSALEARGVAVEAVTVTRPSLDDVYLHHTGRDFRAEDEAGSRG